ncbi:phage baseplate assembly protein [Escherichia coli]|nr:phage baseplate assembly protein [Escherichia coli]
MPGRGNTTTEPTNGVNMLGMDRNTGKPLSGVDHICQSIVDILTTPLGTRVMLPAVQTRITISRYRVIPMFCQRRHTARL